MSDEIQLGRTFEAFNARFLSTSEVANSFVPPPQYDRLIEQNHSVLFGPRGSGKTTLLKMLQLSSLLAWRHEKASVFRTRLPFHAIFLGTDVLWGSQLESRTQVIASPEKSAQIRRTSFRLHLAIAFLNAINECRDPKLADCPELVRFAVDITPDMEIALADALASVWRLTPSTRSLLGLRAAVQAQLSDLLALVNRLRVDPSASLPNFVHIEPILSITQAIDLVNQLFQQPERRWAILCDELEIAPEMIRHELFQLLRSSVQSVVFKFSFFPYSSDVELAHLVGPDAPSAGNDYTPLDLTYGLRESAYGFCQSLLQGMVEKAGGPKDVAPEDVLGSGWFDGGRRNRRATVSAYAAGGELHGRITRLHGLDSSFRYWMSSSKFDIRTIGDLSDVQQAPFRKALPFILTRSEFLRSGGGHRSRKSLSLYSGAYSMFSISEGNPRVFINLMRPLVAEYISREGTVPADMQAKSAETTMHRFKSSLSAIPSQKAGTIKSILHLIDIVGDFFSKAQLDEAFRPEPPVTFVIDEHVAPDLLELVGRTLNAGAFVRLDDQHGAGVSALRGARLRLAYTLAPEYKLPLATGREVSLSSIMGALLASRRRDPNFLSQSRLPFAATDV
jgi:energy-coupling factor transporter ATP-binding protein EcfA2